MKGRRKGEADCLSKGEGFWKKNERKREFEKQNYFGNVVYFFGLKQEKRRNGTKKRKHSRPTNLGEKGRVKKEKKKQKPPRL